MKSGEACPGNSEKEELVLLVDGRVKCLEEGWTAGFPPGQLEKMLFP